MSFMKSVFAALVTAVVLATPGQAADRGKIEAFMQITGFDEALKSLRVNAKNAPAMLGLEAEDFGLSWKLLADDLFEPDQLLTDALDILEQTLEDDALNHAAGFYASDLGQRLVAAENISHFADDIEKTAKGEALAEDLIARDSAQPQLFLDMSDAIGSIDHSIAAYREVQVRFVLAAQASGLVNPDLSEAELRAILSAEDDVVKAEIRENTVSNSAFTYEGFSDEEIAAYLAALSTPQMQRVYELMNAIQYTIMADRYEQMALRMAELHPGQSL